ncbi:hypothetical protein [uncultured Gilvimarinus sp.]|uniref:hypothetical protein n=1 Tax=uncultured Gilvimarinus sp. TaxID=1689143 RepID=UPI0030ED3A64
MKNIHLRKYLNKEGVADILRELKDTDVKFEIYDTCYPSPSDPGAYICYAHYDIASDSFSMTLGNHGWSGGIYKIKSEVVLEQLHHLAITQNDFELNIENAVFFAHYENESAENNVKMNSKLLEIHRGKNA